MVGGIIVACAIFLLCALIILDIFICHFSSGTLNDKSCPKCGGRIRYQVNKELTPENFHIVNYWCENCGYEITLPKKEKESCDVDSDSNDIKENL